MEKSRIDELKEILSEKEREFNENGTLFLVTYEAVQKYKSVRRAIKRGHVTIDGFIIPKRPFHNKANTCKRKGKHSREMNERKKRIYAELRGRLYS